MLELIKKMSNWIKKYILWNSGLIEISQEKSWKKFILIFFIFQLSTEIHFYQSKRIKLKHQYVKKNLTNIWNYVQFKNNITIWSLWNSFFWWNHLKWTFLKVLSNFHVLKIDILSQCDFVDFSRRLSLGWWKMVWKETIILCIWWNCWKIIEPR